MKKVYWTRPAAKDLKKLDTLNMKRVKSAVKDFVITGKGDVRKLVQYENEYRLRIGSKRVRFTFDEQNDAITILRVMTRDKVYE